MTIIDTEAPLVPHDRHLQAQLLSAMAYSEIASLAAAEQLTADDFYGTPHQTLFAAMLDVVDQGNVPSLDLVIAHLAHSNQLEAAGGQAKVVEALTAGGLASVAQATIEKLLQLTVERRCQAFAARTAQRVIDGGSDLLDDIGRDFDDIASAATRSRSTSHDEDIDAYLAQLDEEPGIIPTGIRELDERVGGLVIGSMNCVGALSGHGKSAMVTQLARMIAERGDFVLLVSLEMSREEIFNRMVAQKTRIPFNRINRRKIGSGEKARVAAAARELRELPLKVYTDRSVTPASLKAMVRRYKRDVEAGGGRFGAVFLENLQLWETGGKSFSREQEVASSSRTLKILAQEMEIAVVAAVQMNNNLTNRGFGSEPQMSDIRESSAPYHDSSLVVFVHRPAAIWPEDAEKAGTRPDEAQIIIRKNRNGSAGKCVMFWDGDAQTFHQKPPGLPDPADFDEEL